ncbi:hypothetical protein NP493_10g04045 [Ridgeia piscesae]|uniref:Trafficking protein particle complex subunit n=1 Tax=Ridgeia piscesae TaxID=27915 RepID=A0AAD9PFC4_RIDPI|nr:hypothetical protein NP493_10g04045 [Ridgeia piscesae]
MTIFNLYIFDRNGTCLYYREWNRTRQSGLAKEEEFKLMYGMLFSLKSFITRMSPTDQKEGLLNLRTNQYKLHFYETATGLKFVMNTDINEAASAPNVTALLHEIYQSIYVEFVVKNRLCALDKPIESEIFHRKLDDYIRGLPMFATKTSS